MGLVEDEVSEVSRLCCNVIPCSKLVTCLTSLIRVDINQTDSRQLTVCLRFPNDYPHNKLLLEFKSRSMSSVFLERFTVVCDEKASQFVGKPQVMNILKFIDCYLRENPLCIVTQEIFSIKKLLEGTNGDLKLRQKTSSICLTAKGGPFYYNAKFYIPERYPVERVQWEECDCNLPQALVRFVNGQAKEIARQCVEAPLRKLKNNKEEFKPKPSLERTFRFIIAAMKGFPEERCPICEQLSLPHTAQEVIETDTEEKFLIRMFCGHIYHQGCLKRFMSEPPFPNGGKICPAKRKHPRSDRIGGGRPKQTATVPGKEEAELCQQRVTHDKWGLNDVKSAEAKWAHQQARVRELEEVIDFLQ
ncbi:uncharacterized protein LOC129722703 [Wyeomyia smithii]|uniref:uncharacterized protein LOC129722703 n=1 Tax=Wyeomyia smithii TaxID=174621 RepID=UPI002467C2FA|nr:uncharacterized protein LOC129722703 [Wyeomyia smithii]XP_055532359.1 uncharacterized protein LOC129722703 [Wyeomyia smithii]